MTWLNAIFMGALQGVAEFLPISSSGHLALFQYLFGMKGLEETQLLFTLLLLFSILLVRDTVASLFGNVTAVSCALMLNGVVLFVSDRGARGRKSAKTATVVDALLVGCAQAVAVCPGISRAGATISAGMMRRFDRIFAVRFSFPA